MSTSWMWVTAGEGCGCGTAAGCDAINIARDQHAVDAATDAWIGDRPLVVQGTTIDGDRVEIDLAGPSAAASTGDLYRRIGARLHRRVMLSVRFTALRILDSANASTGP